MRDSSASPPTGWTPERQVVFLHWLERTRSATAAAKKAGMSRESAYRLRARDPGGLFALMWHDIMARPWRIHWGHRVRPSL
ncbi:LysR family transcriptional regulator [Sphingomonas sp. LHG3406-1]|uniref:LysR family transcriptional regulator n=1 Tax=Sphingomonas sp. LHG3406-1 TaxID=2804617 RepID=UPI00262EB2D1|nr:LysR family transcriptional regulator [Sphingomonas sp. LHG3406-1]